MNGKSLIILASIFIFQTIMSCDTCTCPPSRYHLVAINDLEVTPIDGAILKEPSAEGMHFANLLLIAKLFFSAERLAYQRSTLGFQSAYACDCAFDETIEFVDPVVQIRIIKNANDQSDDVSSLFGINESIDIDAFLRDGFNVGRPGESQHWLHLEPLETASLTGTMTLTVEIELASGAVLSATTQEITFN